MTPGRQLKVNRTDVTPNRRRGGEILVTLSPKTVGATSGFGGVLTLAPGEIVTEHYHPYSEEFLHVVTGSLEMRMDGEPIRIATEESLLVPIGVRHRLVNIGTEPAQAVFHLSPLAPRPDLGHVDTEAPAVASSPHPEVG